MYIYTHLVFDYFLSPTHLFYSFVDLIANDITRNTYESYVARSR